MGTHYQIDNVTFRTPGHPLTAAKVYPSNFHTLGIYLFKYIYIYIFIKLYIYTIVHKSGIYNTFSPRTNEIARVS